MNKSTLIAMILCGSTAAWTSTALAANNVPGTTGADIIQLGMIKQGTDTTAVAHACVDDGTTGHWYTLGDLNGLTDDVSANADLGDDTLFIVTVNGWAGSTHCQVSGQTWAELLFHGWTAGLAGQGGNDIIKDGGGTHIVIMTGGAGADTIYEASTSSSAHGGADSDILFGSVSGAVDLLYGEDGADCLSVSDGLYNVADCGADTDKTTLTSRPASCESTVTSC